MKVVVETEDGTFTLARDEQGKWYLEAEVRADYAAATLDADTLLRLAYIAAAKT
jgi:hypothetical protein